MTNYSSSTANANASVSAASVPSSSIVPASASASASALGSGGGGRQGGGHHHHHHHRQRLDALRRGYRVEVGSLSVSVVRKIGEGGSSYVYLAKVVSSSSCPSSSSTSSSSSSSSSPFGGSDGGGGGGAPETRQSPRRRRNSNDAAVGSRSPRHGAAPPRPGTSSSSSSSSSPGRKKRSRMPGFGPYSYSANAGGGDSMVVLKATAVGSDEFGAVKLRQAEAEADLLRRLSSHPGVLGLIEAGYHVGDGNGNRHGEGGMAGGLAGRYVGGGGNGTLGPSFHRSSAQSGRGSGIRGGVHYLLLENCPGGSLMDTILSRRKNLLAATAERIRREEEEVEVKLRRSRRRGGGAFSPGKLKKIQSSSLRRLVSRARLKANNLASSGDGLSGGWEEGDLWMARGQGRATLTCATYWTYFAR